MGFKAVAGTSAFTACLILVNAAAPKDALGSVNGVGQTLASGVRGLGPALGGLMWGWSLSLSPAWLPHQYVPFGLMGLLALATDFVYRGLMQSKCNTPIATAQALSRCPSLQPRFGFAVERRSTRSGNTKDHRRRGPARRSMAAAPEANPAAAAAAMTEVPPVDDQLVACALKRHPRIILGTGSSSRRAIMDELSQRYGFTYEIAKADIDEKAIRHEDAQHLVLRLAHAKADAIRAKLQAAAGEAGQPLDGLLVTCDQVVLHEGQILEKPEDEAEARRYIAGYGRAPASTVGSVVLTDLASGASWEGVDVATIHFAPIPGDSVDRLIAEGEVFWCAGGLMVEHELVQPHVIRMDGSLDSVMGLDKQLLLRLLCAAGAAEDAAASQRPGSRS